MNRLNKFKLGGQASQKLGVNYSSETLAVHSNIIAPSHQTYLGFSVEICWSIFPCNLHISAECLVSPYMLQVPVLLPNTYNCWNSLNIIIQTSSLPVYYLVAPEPQTSVRCCQVYIRTWKGELILKYWLTCLIFLDPIMG